MTERSQKVVYTAGDCKVVVQILPNDEEWPYWDSYCKSIKGSAYLKRSYYRGEPRRRLFAQVTALIGSKRESIATYKIVIGDLLLAKSRWDRWRGRYYTSTQQQRLEWAIMNAMRYADHYHRCQQQADETVENVGQYLTAFAEANELIGVSIKKSVD